MTVMRAGKLTKAKKKYCYIEISKETRKKSKKESRTTSLKGKGIVRKIKEQRIHLRTAKENVLINF